MPVSSLFTTSKKLDVDVWLFPYPSTRDHYNVQLHLLSQENRQTKNQATVVAMSQYSPSLFPSRLVCCSDTRVQCLLNNFLSLLQGLFEIFHIQHSLESFSLDIPCKIVSIVSVKHAKQPSRNTLPPLMAHPHPHPRRI